MALVRREYRLEMALARGEFERLLPAAVDSMQGRLEGNRAWGASSDIAWSLHVLQGSDRRLGQLTLPTLYVTLEVEAGHPDGIGQFVERFLLAYRRAGG
jgi:hypothetical protein